MPPEAFPKTSWTLIARAGAQTPEGHAALSALCTMYWFPVYAFIRRRGGSSEDAYDSTQGFFAQLLERKDIAKVDRDYGTKFRTWLLRCVKNYLANEYDAANAQCRLPPGGLESLSADTAEDRYAFEPSHDLTPERLYERHFALSLLDRVAGTLRAWYVKAGKEHVFEALKGCLSGETGREPYGELAVSLGMKTPEAVRKAAFDMRKRYKDLLRAEVANVVDSEDDAVVKQELRHMLEAISDEAT
jgi:DNA-directed RNA polymerase specialized sigma24 family protein